MLPESLRPVLNHLMSRFQLHHESGEQCPDGRRPARENMDCSHSRQKENTSDNGGKSGEVCDGLRVEAKVGGGGECFLLHYRNKGDDPNKTMGRGDS